MNGSTHVAIGLALAALAGGGPAELAAVALGSLAPDIDNAGAISRPIQNLLPRIIPKIGLLNTIDGVTELGGKVVKKVFGHRGFTHWPVVAGVVWLIGAQFTPLAMWFVLGWIAHVYADSLTTLGAPIFAPFSFGRHRLLPKVLAFRTGGLAERALGYGLWAYLVTRFAFWVWSLL